MQHGKQLIKQAVQWKRRMFLLELFKRLRKKTLCLRFIYKHIQHKSRLLHDTDKCLLFSLREHHTQSNTGTHTRVMTVSENVTGLEYILV